MDRHQEPRVTEQAAEDIRIARHAVFNLKEFRAGRSIFPGEALGILESALDRLAAQAAHAGADMNAIDRQAQIATDRIMRLWADSKPGLRNAIRQEVVAAIATSAKGEMK